MKKNRCPLAFLLALWCAFSLVGCIPVPVRMTTVITDPSHQKQSLPDDPPIPGKTTRQQVEQQYEAFAVESGVPNLFWGRFRKSSWALAADRVWSDHNVLVSFDSNGIVKSFDTVPDSELLDHLVSLCKAQAIPPLDLSTPVHIGGVAELNNRVDVQLFYTGLEVTRPRPSRNPPKRPKPSETITIPSVQLTGIEVGFTGEFRPILVILKLSEKTIFGKRLVFEVEPHMVLTLARWLEQLKAEKG
jgi:hypothetical protein